MTRTDLLNYDLEVYASYDSWHNTYAAAAEQLISARPQWTEADKAHIRATARMWDEREAKVFKRRGAK